MTSQPAWLRALVHEKDIEPKAAMMQHHNNNARMSSTSHHTSRRRSSTAQLPPFDKDLECKHCGKAFRRVCNYREHQRVHSNEYKFACTVAGCDRKFMWRSSIQAHLRSHQAKLHRRRAAARPRSPIVKPQQLIIPKMRAMPLPPLSPVSPLPPSNIGSTNYHHHRPVVACSNRSR